VTVDFMFGTVRNRCGESMETERTFGGDPLHKGGLG
jgi:hypothetical protein